MTALELYNKWASWTESHGETEESVNDFCNINASSYEEYMTIWELLTDLIMKGEN